MKKQVYSQPVISIVEMHVENLMLSVSTNPGGGGPGEAHAPGRIIGDGQRASRSAGLFVGIRRL